MSERIASVSRKELLQGGGSFPSPEPCERVAIVGSSPQLEREGSHDDLTAFQKSTLGRAPKWLLGKPRLGCCQSFQNHVVLGHQPPSMASGEITPPSV